MDHRYQIDAEHPRAGGSSIGKSIEESYEGRQSPVDGFEASVDRSEWPAIRKEAVRLHLVQRVQGPSGDCGSP